MCDLVLALCQIHAEDRRWSSDWIEKPCWWYLGMCLVELNMCVRYADSVDSLSGFDFAKFESVRGFVTSR